MLYSAACFVLLSVLPVVRLQDCQVLADCDRGTATWKPYFQDVGIAGQKGEPGCGCDDEEGPKLYFASNTMPYAAAEPFCNNLGRTLCKFDDICKPADNGRTLVSEVIPGDHWVPIADEVNDWVEVGTAYVDACFRHIPWGQAPSWGTTSDSLQYRGYIYCCPALTPTMPDMIFDYIGKGATYATSQAHCKSKNMRLCYGSEICQDSKPKYGILTKDMWVAIQDQENNWIELGNTPHEPCIRHIDDLGSAPPWGIRTDGSPLPHVGYIYCCSEGGTP